MSTTPTEPSAERAAPYRHFDGMCWPAPCERLGDCAWTLTHGGEVPDALRRQMLVAASVISAYQELVRLPQRQRNAIVRELRKGPAIVKGTP